MLRMHHELHAKPDLVVLHNIDYSVFGMNLIPAVNALKREGVLR